MQYRAAKYDQKRESLNFTFGRGLGEYKLLRRQAGALSEMGKQTRIFVAHGRDPVDYKSKRAREREREA